MYTLNYVSAVIIAFWIIVTMSAWAKWTDCFKARSCQIQVQMDFCLMHGVTEELPEENFTHRSLPDLYFFLIDKHKPRPVKLKQWKPTEQMVSFNPVYPNPASVDYDRGWLCSSMSSFLTDFYEVCLGLTLKYILIYHYSRGKYLMLRIITSWDRSNH